VPGTFQGNVLRGVPKGIAAGPFGGCELRWFFVPLHKSKAGTAIALAALEGREYLQPRESGHAAVHGAEWLWACPKKIASREGGAKYKRLSVGHNSKTRGF
jgi:hypothetical protein